MDSRSGAILIFLSALLFGSYGVWNRMLGPHFGVFFQGWTRGLIVALILVPILVWNNQFVPIKRKDWGWLTVYLLFTSLTQAPIYYAFNHMNIGSASLLFFASMLLTMFFVGFFFLGEKMTKVKIISLIVALVGMYAVFSFSAVLFTVLAALMAVVNGIASGGEVSFSKKLSGNYSPLYLCWLSWVIIFITNLPVSLILGEAQRPLSFTLPWLYQLGLSLTGLLAFWLIIKGLKYVESSVGGLLGLLEIVFSVFFGIMLFGESLTGKVLFGSVCIIGAAALPHAVGLMDKHRKSRKAPG